MKALLRTVGLAVIPALLVSCSTPMTGSEMKAAHPPPFISDPNIDPNLTIQGRSVEGRKITCTVLGSGEETVLFLGGIHGSEPAGTVLCRKLIDYLFRHPAALWGRRVVVAPAVNPDAVHHYLAEPHSHWRPRFNYRPFDSDGDGKIDEDPYEDIDGDGEIGLMYQPDDGGDYTLKDGRLVRAGGQPRYKLIGREGIDNDRDGRFSEDSPGGVDLNRNFPVGFQSRNSLGGWSGPSAASEPEAKAVVDFISKRPPVERIPALLGNQP